MKSNTIFVAMTPKIIRSLTTSIFIISTIALYGQVRKVKNYSPLWTFHQKNLNIHGISLGIGTSRSEPRNTNTNGIKIEIIGAGLIIPLIPQSPVVQNDSEFIKLSQEPISEVINGLGLSAFGTVCDCITNGINLGLIGHYNFKVNGISASLFMNFSQIQNGMMTAFFNDAYYISGLQLGVSNNGYKAKGVQIGLFNKSDELQGLQIGLWNVNQKRKLPLINWNFNPNKH